VNAVIGHEVCVVEVATGICGAPGSTVEHSRTRVSAVSIGDRVVTNGVIESWGGTDEGVFEAPYANVPALSTGWLGVCSALLLVLGARIARPARKSG
jgi:hypothetical protein